MESLQVIYSNMASNLTTIKEMEWYVKFRDPKDIWENHPSFLMCEIMYFTLAFLTFVHAMRNGGRYPWLWIGVILHGIVVELVSYFLPDIDNFWHAQGMIMFVGQRLPLYIVLIFGLTVVLIDVPYDIMGIKLLWWTWHDTDPNIYDRHYWVPWTSYYFHATFASGFTFAFHGIHKLLSKEPNKFQSAGFFKELVCCLIAAMCGFPLGTLQFLPIYHPLHDSNQIHTEVCVCLLFAMYVMIIWSADRTNAPDRVQSQAAGRKNKYFNEIILLVLLHYGLYIYLVLTAQPEKIRATGLHEPVGPCQETVPVVTAFGHTLAKNKYLCVEKYDEAVFDFHCVKTLPKPGESWYTICGTKFPNHLEYIIVVCGFCGFGILWFVQLMIRSSSLPRPRTVKPKQN
ncbi:hypothetical protein KUTeg_003356 [Tegillarca granosa]|uniref:DUF7802 domain-containing protein n=1 Tax=Tegillarca granosa TaxID=220873 RepID=A0ABQ9FPT4_TEGGR|nr:hypothetical protein KUTeg_003356 [Tegillarca granosa]